MRQPQRHPDYGLDAPGVILGALGAGVVLIALALAFEGGLAYAIGALGIVVLALGLATYGSSRYAKLRLRDRLLDELCLRGDEHVLDVGCGRGLLLVGAARRLATGRAVGLDLWVQADQLHNGREAALANATLEGVRERVEIHDGDMRAMPFDDASFDVVVSNLAIHNVASASGRARSIAEIARVLRPGGRVAIMDLAFTSDYARWLREAGLRVRRTWPARWFFPPLGIVIADQPAGPSA